MMNKEERDAMLEGMREAYRIEHAEADARELEEWLARPEKERNAIHRKVRSLIRRRFVGSHKKQGETKSCPECKSKLYFTRSKLRSPRKVWSEDDGCFHLVRDDGSPTPAPICMACGFTPLRPHQTGELPIPEGTPDWVDV